MTKLKGKQVISCCFLSEYFTNTIDISCNTNSFSITILPLCAVGRASQTHHPSIQQHIQTNLLAIHSDLDLANALSTNVMAQFRVKRRGNNFNNVYFGNLFNTHTHTHTRPKRKRKNILKISIFFFYLF